MSRVHIQPTWQDEVLQHLGGKRRGIDDAHRGMLESCLPVVAPEPEERRTVISPRMYTMHTSLACMSYRSWRSYRRAFVAIRVKLETDEKEAKSAVLAFSKTHCSKKERVCRVQRPVEPSQYDSTQPQASLPCAMRNACPLEAYFLGLISKTKNGCILGSCLPTQLQQPDQPLIYSLAAPQANMMALTSILLLLVASAIGLKDDNLIHQI